MIEPTTIIRRLDVQNLSPHAQAPPVQHKKINGIYAHITANLFYVLNASFAAENAGSGN